MHSSIVKQRRTFMLYNLLAFTLIFGLFGLIVYGQVESSLFDPVRYDLYEAEKNILKHSSFVDEQRDFQYPKLLPGVEDGQQPRPEGVLPAEGEPPNQEGEHNPDPKFRMKTYVPMRIQVVLRDATGDIVNAQTLGRFYWEDMLDQIPYSTSRDIFSFHLEDGSVYQSMTFGMENQAGEMYLVQLITNVEGEQSVIDNFLRILVVCVAGFVLMSVAASYVLSTYTMRPIIKSWDRQTEFVANASHELRTPLTIVQNKLEALLTTPQATVLDRADEIVVSLSETRRLGKLTSDLMTLARADSVETQLQKEDFLLDDLVRKVSEPYSELAEMQEKGMVLDLQCGGTLTADKGRIHELMVILLDNALKYTGEGDTIKIRTACSENKTVIEVSDTGIGIPQEDRERIFDRFYRVNKARSRDHGGTGLGLSIAKWIVSAHGGTIKALENPPRGTVFQVKL